MKKVHIILSSRGISPRILTECLSDKLKLLSIPLNDLFRETFNSNTNFALEARSYLDKGELIPDTIINNLIKNRIVNVNTDIQIIRYPRTEKQYISLEKLLNANNFFIEQIWFLKLRDIEQLIQYKLDYEKDKPFTIKFGLNTEAYKKNHLDSISEFEELKKAIPNESLISVLEFDYPIENHIEEIEKCITTYRK